MGGDRFCRFGLAAGEPALRAHQTNLVPRVTLVKEDLLVVLHALPGMREGEITIIIFLLRAGVEVFFSFICSFVLLTSRLFGLTCAKALSVYAVSQLNWVVPQIQPTLPLEPLTGELESSL